MKIVYLISMRDNPLYRGKFRLHDRYRTYGQHSFIYDLIAAASRRGIDIDLVVDGLAEFPLATPLTRYCNVLDFADVTGLPAADLLLLDVVPDAIVQSLAPGTPVFCVVHNAFTRYSMVVRARCDRFLCMTETAFAYQATQIDTSRLVLIHQGVDTQRFRPNSWPGRVRPTRPRILFYSRLDDMKLSAILEVVTRLLSESADLTLLGDGDAFWTISDRFGSELTLINYIPSHSIHRLLPSYDLVISSGRGAMEGLACGLPVLCAGFGYGGPVLPDNIREHLCTNITGATIQANMSDICTHIQDALLFDSEIFRKIAVEHCSVDVYINDLLNTFTDFTEIYTKPNRSNSVRKSSDHN